jgi:hypothetical protein
MAHSEVKQKCTLFSTHFVTVTATLLGFLTRGTRYTLIGIIIEISGDRNIIAEIYMLEYSLLLFRSVKRTWCIFQLVIPRTCMDFSRSYSATTAGSARNAERETDDRDSLDKLGTRLSATYAWPCANICSSKGTVMWGRVSPWVLWTVRANAFCRGNWVLVLWHRWRVHFPTMASVIDPWQAKATLVVRLRPWASAYLRSCFRRDVCRAATSCILSQL